MRVFLYVRKSTDDSAHQVLSLQTQLYELRQLARKNGLTIVEEISESRTARLPGRPEFNKMIARIVAGEVEGILCWKLHRLARNLEDGGKIITLLQMESIRAIHTLEKVYLPGENVVYLAFEFGIATEFSQDLAKDVRIGLQSKLRAGGWPGKAPTGYVNDTVNKVVLPDPMMAPLVRKSFERFASGNYSVSALFRDMTGAGLRNRVGNKLTCSNFDHMLKNPFYYGLMRYRCEFQFGQHEPLITKDLFDRVQQFFRKRHSPRTKSLKPFQYRGMIRCGTCGCMITMELQKGHTYLRCTKRVTPCDERFLREERCNEQFDRYFQTCLVDREIPAMLTDLVEQDRRTQFEFRRIRIENIRNDLEAASGQMDQLLNLLLKGLIDESEYLRQKNILIETIANLKENLRLNEIEPDRFEPLNILITELNEALEFNLEETFSMKRDFLAKISSNLFLRAGEIEVKLKTRWKTLMDWKLELPTAWAEIDPDRKLVLLCSLRDKVRLASSDTSSLKNSVSSE